MLFDDDCDECAIHNVIPVSSTKPIMVSSSTQADVPILLRSQGSQISTIRQHIETQTSLSPSDWLQPDTTIITALQRMSEVMTNELNENEVTSYAYENYDVAWHDERESTSLLHDIQLPAIATATQPQTATTTTTSAAWNSRGMLVAAGTSVSDHRSWCSHRSSVCVWRVDSDTALRAPLVLETSACVTSVSFHPIEPTLLVAGLFTGELRLWDLRDHIDTSTAATTATTATTTSSSTMGGDKDAFVAGSQIDDILHREPIAQIAWVKSSASSSQAYLLVSTSGDGHILFWCIDGQSPPLQHPQFGYKLSPTVKYHGHGTVMNRWSTLGVSTLSFSPLDSGNCVLGTEGGGVLKLAKLPNTAAALAVSGGGGGGGGGIQQGEFQWSVDAYTLLHHAPDATRRDVQREVEKYARLHALVCIQVGDVFAARPPPTKLYPSAASFAYKAHASRVYSVTFSPYHRNLFITCSMDGCIHLSHALRPHPITVIEVRALSAAPITFNASSTPAASTTSNSSSSSSSSSSVTCAHHVAWSSVRPTVFACATNDCRMHVFDLSVSMMTPVVTIATHTPASTITFSPTDGAMLLSSHTTTTTSAAAAAGRLCVWHLNSVLGTLRAGDMKLIDQLGRAGHHAAKTKMKAVAKVFGMRATVAAAAAGAGK